jgi:peptide/nickel transport system substrate-binding protein
LNISFFKFFFYLFIVGILFNGCADDDSPKKRDGLIVYQESQISWTRNFNPLSPAGTARWPTKCGVYEPLYIYNSMTTKWVPWLAESYRWKRQNKVLEVKIRDNVVWSDGVPFTANDVAFTTNIKKKFTALDTRNAWAYLESVKATSNNTVEYVFSKKNVPGFDAIITQIIVPEHIWSKIKDPVKYRNPNPIGTGPFTEILRFDNQIWELGKNNNYWQKGKPYIDKLVFPTFPSNEQVTLALNSGNLDWAGAFIPAVDRVFVEKNPEHHKYWFPLTGHTTFLYTNTKDKALKDINIRKAISYAIDRDLVVKVGMYDYTEPAHVTGITGPMSTWHYPDMNSLENWTKFNPEKSAHIFNKAGFELGKDGFRRMPNGDQLELEIIVVSGWSDWIRSAQVVSQNLNKVGIKTKVKTYDFGAWISRMQKGEFQLAIGWTEKGSTPYNMYKGMMSSDYVKPIGEIADVNWHRFGSEKADYLLKKYEITSDLEEVRDIIYDLQKIFIKNTPSLPLFAEASWGEFNTTFFTNFPSADNPYGTLSPNYESENLFLMLNVRPR